ncbi:Protein-disulfide isomerase [Sanguibacter gelidistatuariae]|uniref:Protein-disulfide isomerase n=1 Tax=Sanguibacter gelidistatuariae TaxID=1814289 RepID=A0A1G6MLT5_9MICO|nr:thioredoxin domain-containing protein [Sanguibacter gelidistatuariae]SDC56578.1 Protein-disulfide isomerase [Sanguibacter gelidistatuariae]
MFATVSRRLPVLGAAVTGAVLLSVVGCSADPAGKNASEVTASASAEASESPDGTATDVARASGLPTQGTFTTTEGVPLTITGESIILGEVTAPTRVLIYQDMACPHCNSLHGVLGGDLVTWASGGDVAIEIVTVDFLGQSSKDFSTAAANLLATVAAHDPASWIVVQDAIFEAQADAPSPTELAQFALDAGSHLDDAALAAYTARAYDPFVDAATDAAFASGIQSVPQVFVDGVPVRGDSYEAWGQAVRDAVEASVNGG